MRSRPDAKERLEHARVQAASGGPVRDGAALKLECHLPFLDV
jgi:hypothetical protein